MGKESEKQPTGTQLSQSADKDIREEITLLARQELKQFSGPLPHPEILARYEICLNMLTFEEAKKIGIKACVDKLGGDFVKKYNETSCTAYGDEGDHAFCFVGGDTNPVEPWTGGPLIMDDSPEAKFPYSASCNVSYCDGEITFLECALPSIA